MNKFSISDKNPELILRTIVACIKQATEDDAKLYLQTYNPKTTNGLPHQIHDWINTNLDKHINSDKSYTMEIKRSTWRGRIIVDEENQIVYSVMRVDRLKSLRKEKRDKPHYVQTMVGILNSELEPKHKQLTLEEFAEFTTFSKETLVDDYNRMFGGSLNPEKGYHHCLVLFDARKLELYDARLCIVDKNLNIVEDKSLVEYIRPDYAKLTATKPIEDESQGQDNTVQEAASTTKAGTLIKLKEIKKKS